MKRLYPHLIAREFTRSENFRQKLGVLQNRGPIFYSRVSVRSLPNLTGRPRLALLAMGPHHIFCAIGRNGIGPKRHEGDGITPFGRFVVIDWLRRRDSWRVSRPDSHAIKRKDGWCDDPKSHCYNRQVVLPFRARTEALWRDDRLYDLVGLLNFNWRPRILGRGSAIFLHIAHSDYRATAGCVALTRSDIQKAQWLWRRRLQIDIGGFSVRPRTPKIADPTRT